MRRRYHPLFAQQDLGAVEAVAPAMNLPAATAATLKRWSAVTSDKQQELDREGADLDQAGREIYMLNAARIKAETRLLGSETYYRYQHLLTAFINGKLDEALHPDRKAPGGIAIVTVDRVRPHAPPDTAKYDGLFK